MLAVSWYWHGEGGYLVAVVGSNFGHSFFFYLVYPYYEVHGNERSLHTLKFIAQLFFAGVDDHLGLVAERIVFDLYKAIKLALVYVACVNFVDLTLVLKKHAVKVLIVVFVGRE